MTRITMACTRCGGENVTRDATARWSVDTQDWELSTVHDDTSCEDCEADLSLEEKSLASGEHEPAKSGWERAARAAGWQLDSMDFPIRGGLKVYSWKQACKASDISEPLVEEHANA